MKFKIRHQPEFNSGKLIRSATGNQLISDTKISGIAPGQFAVLYDLEEKNVLEVRLFPKDKFHLLK